MTEGEGGYAVTNDIEAIRQRWCLGEGMRPALDRIANTQADISVLLSEVDRLRKRTHEIQETADKRYSELVQRTERPLEYWRSALAQADKSMKDPGVVFHSAITRAKAADLFMQIEQLQAENERLRAVLQMIQQWDCLNLPVEYIKCVRDASDFPWLKRLVDDALASPKIT